jgi:hypothetical protein
VFETGAWINFEVICLSLDEIYYGISCASISMAYTYLLCSDEVSSNIRSLLTPFQY